MINEPLDKAVIALYSYYEQNNRLQANWHGHKTQEEVNQLRIEAQKFFARVDWVEPEVDPETIEGKYLEMVFQAGRRCGMLTLDEMTEAEVKLYGVFDDLN
jgi:hypothetical protein